MSDLQTKFEKRDREGWGQTVLGFRQTVSQTLPPTRIRPRGRMVNPRRTWLAITFQWWGAHSL